MTEKVIILNEDILNNIPTPMTDDNDKTDHHIVINSYVSYNINEYSFILPFLSMLTIFFLIQKLNDNLMVKWQATFYPIFLYFIYKFIVAFIQILKTEGVFGDNDTQDKKIKILT